MSADNGLSLHFYKYLCHTIGSEEEVKIRRLTYLIDDLGKCNNDYQITSGSKGEGLQLKGSDYDLMFVDPCFKVYESEKDVVLQSKWCIPLVMETDDTHPCFTQLRLVNNHYLIVETEQIKEMKENILIGTPRKVSSELYRLYYMNQLSDIVGIDSTSILKIHGPCISSFWETQDCAWCLKCDTWISQAEPWIIRPRTTWPPPNLITEITSCGVLYVPIGYKGSTNESLQWRISFSVAEKILIFSFNHVQLLCYALLKILAKEIVEKEDDLKSLLCSYFLKTLMFWMLEESDPLMWRPNKMITCFKSCLKRLIYCVEYSTLLHYFIPDNNLFYLRFDVVKQQKMTRFINNLLGKGINCFARSETLSDIRRLSFNATDSLTVRCVLSINELTNTVSKHSFNRSLKRLYHSLRHASTKISRSIFVVMLSFAHQSVPQVSQDQPRSNNKHKYYKYKRDRSHLMIGTNSDAVGGWLLLASFFYVHGNYFLSLEIISHTLRKCTDEKLYPWQIGLYQNQENLLRLLKQAELCILSKAFTVKYPHFNYNSPISPQELQLNQHEYSFPFHPMVFANFLSFLCFHHLNKRMSRQQSLLHMELTIMQHFTSNQCYSYFKSILLTCLGICHQMIGKTYVARQCFHRASQLDKHNITSAAMRLSKCNVD